MHGYLSEHHSFGETDEKAGEYAEDLAASMLATTLGIEFNPELDWDEREQIFNFSGHFEDLLSLGIEFNPELDWDEREQIFKMSGKIVRTTNITQSAIGNKDGLWTTVFSAAVFINEESTAPESGKSNGSERSSLQEEILRNSLQNRPESFDAPTKFIQRNERPRRPSPVESFIQPAKKNFP